MSFIVIIACFAVQWFLNVSSAQYEWNWAEKYTQKMMSQKWGSLEKGHGLFTMLFLVLPIVIVVSLIFTIVYHTMGHIGYLILSLFLLWYCTDITMLKKGANAESSSDLFLKSYQKLFAPLLWYFVFGPVALALYVVVATLRAQLPDQHYFVLTHGVLDWVPIRLVGLTFALAGNFGAVFKIWVKELFQSVRDNQSQVVLFGDAALAADSDALSLMHRTLLIWLVVMALIKIGSWFG